MPPNDRYSEDRRSDLEREVEELKTRERRYLSFLKATNAAIWEWDVMADRTEWNEGMYRVFGYPLDHATPFDWWFSRIHPDDARNILTSIESAIKSSAQTWIGEYRFRRKDEAYAWVLDRAYIERDQNGKPLSMLGAMLDITDRKNAEEALRKSEERFKRLRESNVIGIVTADLERIQEANEAFLNLVGYTQDDVKAGRLRWAAVLAPEYHEAIEQSRRELEETGLMQPHEKEYIRSDGTRVAVMVGGAALQTDPLCAMLFVVDVSEFKDLERRLHEAEKWEALGVLAGGVAHDFNNLLTTITVSATMTRDMLAEDHPGRRYLDYVIESAESAAKLTAQLLAYAGKGTGTMEVVNIRALVRRLAGQLRGLVPGHIELSFDLADGMPGIKADPRQMEQAVITLVVNAAEAVGENPGRISVRTRSDDVAGLNTREGYLLGTVAPGRYIILEVEDTGHGMRSETAAKVFDPFYTTKFPGRGLGLAAVSGIVRRHNGAIQVISEPQHGTLFRVLLPVG